MARWLIVFVLAGAGCVREENVVLPENTRIVVLEDERGRSVHALAEGRESEAFTLRRDGRVWAISIEASLVELQLLPGLIVEVESGRSLPPSASVELADFAAEGGFAPAPLPPLSLPKYDHAACWEVGGCLAENDEWDYCRIPCDAPLEIERPMPPAAPNVEDVPPLAACPSGQVQLYGESSCAAIGDPCPSGDYSEVDADRRVRSPDVDDPTAFASLTAALVDAPPGSRISLSKGRHAGAIVDKNVELIGACPGETWIDALDVSASITASNIGATVFLARAGSSTVTRARFSNPANFAVQVIEGASLVLEDSSIDRGHQGVYVAASRAVLRRVGVNEVANLGLYALSGARLSANDVVISNGWIGVERASFDARKLRIDHPQSTAISVFGAGARADITEVAVFGGTHGGIIGAEGASLNLRRATVSGGLGPIVGLLDAEGGVFEDVVVKNIPFEGGCASFVITETPRFAGRRLRASDTDCPQIFTGGVPDLLLEDVELVGRGAGDDVHAFVTNDGRQTLGAVRRMAIVEPGGLGVHVRGAADLLFEDLTVRGTRHTGLTVFENGVARVRRVRVEDAHIDGIHVTSRGTLTATSVSVARVFGEGGGIRFEDGSSASFEFFEAIDSVAGILFDENASIAPRVVRFRRGRVTGNTIGLLSEALIDLDEIATTVLFSGNEEDVRAPRAQ